MAVAILTSILLICHITTPCASSFASPNHRFSIRGTKVVPHINVAAHHGRQRQQHANGNYLCAITNHENENRRIQPLAAATINEGTTTDDCDTDDADNPITSAGLSFVSASSKSLGMLFYNIGGMDHKEIQALLLRAGTHLVSAGRHWSSDWDVVRESMYSASRAFYSISDVFGSSQIDESMPLGDLFERIGRELEDISSIGGCCAVGPPCSSPNLLAVEETLIEVSRILKKNSVASTDEHMMCTLFREVAELFGEMAGRYVDHDGQGSEVTV